MLRTAVRLTPNFIIPLFGHKNNYDQDMINCPQPEKLNTGWERVKRMYTRNEYEEVSVELHNVVQASLCGAFFGACMGGFAKSRDAYVYFIENNQATIFKSTMQAKKKLQDQVTIAFARGAYHWGWRLGIFSGMFSLISTTISTYRGDTSIIEYVTAGALTGGLYKANLGLAATFVGAGLGAAISTVVGLAILGILKVTGLSMVDIRNAMYKIKTAREDQFHQAIEKAAQIKHDDLTKHHEELLKQKGLKDVGDVS